VAKHKNLLRSKYFYKHKTYLYNKLTFEYEDYIVLFFDFACGQWIGSQFIGKTFNASACIHLLSVCSTWIMVRFDWAIFKMFSFHPLGICSGPSVLFQTQRPVSQGFSDLNTGDQGL